jgi:hypothetical protein
MCFMDFNPAFNDVPIHFHYFIPLLNEWGKPFKSHLSWPHHIRHALEEAGPRCLGKEDRIEIGSEGFEGLEGRSKGPREASWL